MPINFRHLEVIPPATVVGTVEEIMFVRALGRGKFNKPVPEERVSILQKYKEALEKRVNWGSIDPFIVKREVQLELRKEGY